MKRFVSVDLETSGLDPLRHEIIEVGLVVEKNHGQEHGGALSESIVLEQHTFSLPFDERRADAKALEVNGWGKREFPAEVEPSWAATFLAEVLDDVHIIGKNPIFDTGFLNVFLAKHGISPTWHHRLVDIGPLTWGWYNGVVRALTSWHQPPNSEQVAQLTGVEWPDRHSALADAQFAYNVFRKIVPYPPSSSSTRPQ